MRGKQQPYLSIPKILKSHYARKLAGLLNRVPRTQLFDSKRKVDFGVFNWPATLAVYVALRGKVKSKFKPKQAPETQIRRGLRIDL